MAELRTIGEFASALRAMTQNGESGAFFITTPDRHSALLTVKDGGVSGVKYRHRKGEEAVAELAKLEQLTYRKAPAPTELPGCSAVDSKMVLDMLSGKSKTSSARPGLGSMPGSTASKVQEIARNVGSSQPVEAEAKAKDAAADTAKAGEAGTRKTGDAAAEPVPATHAPPEEAASSRPVGAAPQPSRQQEKTVDLEPIRERFLSAVGPIGNMLFEEATEHLGEKAKTPQGANTLVRELASEISDEEEAQRFKDDILGK